MKRSRFTEEQIIGFIKQAQVGMPIKEPFGEPAVRLAKKISRESFVMPT